MVLVKVVLSQSTRVDPEVAQLIMLALSLKESDFVISFFARGSAIDPVIVGNFLTFFPGMRENRVTRDVVSIAESFDERESTVDADL